MKKIIVTDSSSVLGLLAVQELALNGHIVYATMHDIQSKNARLAHDLRQWTIANNVDVRITEIDVTSDESVNHAVTEIMCEAKQIDVLINNAGAPMLGSWEDLKTKEIEQVFQVNVFGAIRMNTAILPYMRMYDSGLIIQLSSYLSRLHLPYLSAYCAAQAALDTLAETLSYELINTGIDSVIIQPGAYPDTQPFSQIVPINTSSQLQREERIERRIEQGIYQLLTRLQNGNWGEVANLIVEIVDMHPNKRKLWTTTGIDLGQTYVDFINDSTSQYSQRIQKLAELYSINNR